MKKIIISLLMILLVGCNNQLNDNSVDKNTSNLNEVIDKVQAIINGEEYLINLEDNETVRSFINLLPNDFKMSELNGNEKYIYLDKSLPTNPYHPEKINAGDVMLFGDNCLVIFYKSFSTSYQYTKIGHIDNLPDLGNNNLLVTIKR